MRPPLHERDLHYALLVTWLAGSAVFIYALATPARPHREALLGIVVLSLGIASTMFAGPVSEVLRRRPRGFFAAWASSYTLAVSTLVHLDGGIESPMTLFFGLPLVFAALTAGPSGAVGAGILTFAGFSGVAFADPAGSNPEWLLSIVACACIAAVCARQAALAHAGRAALRRQRDELRFSEEGLARAEARARRRADEHAAVARLAERALAGASVPDLAEDAVRALADTLDLEFAEVSELEGDLLRIQAHVGWSTFDRFPAHDRQSQSAYALECGGPVLVRDATREDRFDCRYLLGSGLLSGIMAPLRGEGARPLGAIGCHSRLPHAFGEEDVRFLQAVAGVLGTAIARSQAEARLRHQSLHDPLTALPNRSLLLERLRTMSMDPAAPGVTLLFCDLDEFKDVNDRFGHAAGDEVLRQVAARLLAVLEPEDVLARLGGDEFVVVRQRAADRETAAALGDHLRDALRARPFLTPTRDGGSAEQHLGTSVGVVFAAPGEGWDPAALMRDADAAMYRAKDRGRSRTEIFDTAARDRALVRVQTKSDLHRALRDRELSVAFQPIVATADGRVIRAEALLRWDHPQRGRVPPDEFIPLAEESGIISGLHDYVLEEVAGQLAAWAGSECAVLRDLRVAVNLSARLLADPGLAQTTVAVLERHGVSPQRIVYEITETALLADADRAAVTLAELRTAGVRLALDDFGTGYSALVHLKRYPLSAIKLDRSFVDGLAHEPEDQAIVEGLIRIAGDIGLSTIAEGVERTDQLDRLRRLGCDFIQGHVFAPALDARAFERYARGLRGGVAEPARQLRPQLQLVG